MKCSAARATTQLLLLCPESGAAELKKKRREPYKCVCLMLLTARQGELALNFNFQETSYGQRIFCITAGFLYFEVATLLETPSPERLYSSEK